MNKILTLLIFLFVSATAMAQTVGTVKGKLVDSLNKQSLKDASVTVLDARDSTLEVFGLAKADGTFNLTNITFGKMILVIKFQGYEPFYKTIIFSKANAMADLGVIPMKTADNTLQEVVVTQSAMRMKGDTIEANAGSFKTKPNAVAEDLLKKIPGMEVAKDGSIKAQGEAVTRVLVNGKRFFGDDPKLATKNLPSDVIDKIQIFDDLSDQAKFTGFDDGNRVKTLNITTRKDMRKGAFGKAVVGAGTDGNFDESFNLSVVDGDKQFTFLGQGNDINKQNFTQQNIGGGRGGGGGGGGATTGSPSGVTTIWAGGLNYRDAWSKNVDAYGSYFYNAPKLYIQQASNTQNVITADSSTYNNSASTSTTNSANHRINFNIEDRIDSNNSLIFRPNVTFQNSNPVSVSSNTTTAGPKGLLTTQTTSQTSSYNSGYNISGSNLTFRHKLAKKGRTISVDLGFSASDNTGDGLNYSVNTYTRPLAKVDTINQRYVDSARSISLNPTISYTEPVGKNQMIELRYSYSYNNSTSINNTFRYDNTLQKFSQFDSLYSNSYKYTATSSTANLSYRISKTKYNFNIGTGLQFLDINSNNTTKDVIVARNFVNFTPTANFTYNFSRSQSLRVFYTGRTGQPSTSQLQPVKTTSDSINFQIGNPDLKPQFTNSIRVLYTNFDAFTQRVIFATINASIIGNDIQSSITTLPTGGRQTTYVNLSGTYNISGYFNYGFPLKIPKSNLNFQTNANYSQSQSLQNGLSSYTKSTTLGETIKWTTNIKKNFDMNLSTSYTINPVRNTLTPSQNTNYTTLYAAADFTVYSNNGWQIASDFDITQYGGRPVGYNSSVFLITPSIAKTFLKNKAGELRLSCFDVLQQNKTVTSSASANQFITSTTNNLTRYFMLTFTYNLRSFAGQQQQQRGNQMRMMQGMPGMGMPGGFGGGGGGNRRGDE